jgi:hypothetical protein
MILAWWLVNSTVERLSEKQFFSQLTDNKNRCCWYLRDRRKKTVKKEIVEWVSFLMQFLSPDAFLMSTHGNVYRYRLIVMKKIIINGSYINGTIAKKIEIFIGGVAHTSDTPNCNMLSPGVTKHILQIFPSVSVLYANRCVIL